MVHVQDGRQRVGFVPRGRRGYEAFDAWEASLGLFKMQDAAIGKLTTGNKQT
jgi:hypothetical protein